jgi:hypothetical protein
MGAGTGEVVLKQEEVFISSTHVLSALKRITGEDFGFLKGDWYQWWVKTGQDKLIPKPKPSPAAPGK